MKNKVDFRLALAEPRLTRTRKAIINAGRRLLSAGREGATIDEIVQEADVSKGSFYNHFNDRDTFFEFVRTATRAELLAEIAQVNAGISDAPTQLTRGMLTSFRFGLKNSLSARIMIHLTDQVTNPDYPSNNDIVYWLECGAVDESLDPPGKDACIALILGLSYLGLSRLLELQHDRTRTRETMRDICIALLRGLGAEPTRIEVIVDQALGPVHVNEAAHRSRQARQMWQTSHQVCRIGEKLVDRP